MQTPGPTEVVNLALGAVASRHWTEVLRWMHPVAVERIAQRKSRSLKAVFAEPAKPAPGDADAEFEAELAASLFEAGSAQRAQLLRDWRIRDLRELDELPPEEVCLRGLALDFQNEFPIDAGLPGGPRAIGVVTESETVAHVVIRRDCRVEYSWWGPGMGWPMIVTTVSTPSGWRIYAQPELFSRALSEQSAARRTATQIAFATTIASVWRDFDATTGSPHRWASFVTDQHQRLDCDAVRIDVALGRAFRNPDSAAGEIADVLSGDTGNSMAILLDLEERIRAEQAPLGGMDRLLAAIGAFAVRSLALTVAGVDLPPILGGTPLANAISGLVSENLSAEPIPSGARGFRELLSDVFDHAPEIRFAVAAAVPEITELWPI